MNNMRRITVLRGDSTSILADRYGMTIPELLDANPGKATAPIGTKRVFRELREGESLNVFTGGFAERLPALAADVVREIAAKNPKLAAALARMGSDSMTVTFPDVAPPSCAADLGTGKALPVAASNYPPHVPVPRRDKPGQYVVPDGKGGFVIESMLRAERAFREIGRIVERMFGAPEEADVDLAKRIVAAWKEWHPAAWGLWDNQGQEVRIRLGVEGFDTVVRSALDPGTGARLALFPKTTPGVYNAPQADAVSREVEREVQLAEKVFAPLMAKLWRPAAPAPKKPAPIVAEVRCIADGKTGRR